MKVHLNDRKTHVDPRLYNDSLWGLKALGDKQLSNWKKMSAVFSRGSIVKSLKVNSILYSLLNDYFKGLTWSLLGTLTGKLSSVCYLIWCVSHETTVSLSDVGTYYFESVGLLLEVIFIFRCLEQKYVCILHSNWVCRQYHWILEANYHWKKFLGLHNYELCRNISV